MSLVSDYILAQVRNKDGNVNIFWKTGNSEVDDTIKTEIRKWMVNATHDFYNPTPDEVELAFNKSIMFFKIFMNSNGNPLNRRLKPETRYHLNQIKSRLQHAIEIDRMCDDENAKLAEEIPYDLSPLTDDNYLPPDTHSRNLFATYNIPKRLSVWVPTKYPHNPNFEYKQVNDLNHPDSWLPKMRTHLAHQGFASDEIDYYLPANGDPLKAFAYEFVEDFFLRMTHRNYFDKKILIFWKFDDDLKKHLSMSMDRYFEPTDQNIYQFFKYAVWFMREFMDSQDNNIADHLSTEGDVLGNSILKEINRIKLKLSEEMALNPSLAKEIPFDLNPIKIESESTEKLS